MIKQVLIVVVFMSMLGSCVAIKEYEKVNINDPDMTLSDKKSKRYVTIFHSYREAATGGNGGKTGGGCGCN